MKYNYQRTIETPEGVETFTAVECASFDEAQKVVEKGIHDRKLQLHEKYATKLAVQHIPGGAPVSTTTPQIAGGGQKVLHNEGNATGSTTPAGSETPSHLSGAITRA